MDDTISRAYILEALGHFNDYVNGDPHFLNGIETAKEITENAPAVDAAPVVRCSECKFGKLCIDADGHSLIQCTNSNYPTANVETWPLELDWYCAGGERKEDE